MEAMKFGTKTYAVLLLLSITIAFDRAAAQAPQFLKRHEIALQGSTNKRSFASIQDTLSLVGQWGWGVCYAAVARDHYLFIGNGSLLQVYDDSNPANLKELGEVDVGNLIYGFVLSGNYAYTAPGFAVIDISDVTHPHIVGTVQIPALDGTIAVKDNYVFVGDVDGAIYTINVSNPARPFTVNGRPMILANGTVVSISIADTFLYAAGGWIDDYPRIYDISNEESPVLIPSSFGYWGPLTCTGHYLYLGAGEGANEFCVYDITNPTNPRWVNGAYLSALPFSISIKDTLAFVWEEDKGFEVVDIADTSNFYVLAKVPYLYHASIAEMGPVSGTFSSSVAYLAGKNGLWTLDIGKLPEVTSLSFLGTGGFEVVNMATDTSGHAFLAETYGGLKIIDFTDPSSPHIVSQYNPDEWVRDVAVCDKRAYVVCDYDMAVLDLSDISLPKVISKVSFGDTINDDNGFLAVGTITAFDSVVYVARNSSNLYRIDVSDPSHPVIRDIQKTVGVPLAISKLGPYLYVALADSGIEVFNISDPTRLVLAGVIGVKGMACLSINKGDLYLVANSRFFKYKILDSLDLETLGSFEMTRYDWTSQIKFAEKFAYTFHDNYLVMTDVEDSTAPLTPCTLYDSYEFTSLGVADNLILLPRYSNSLFIIRNNLISDGYTPPPVPQSLVLYQNYPNPFNPTTRIKFELPNTGRVILKIYDVLGRRIATLLDEEREAGVYIVEFKPKNLASGVYFYTLSLNGETMTRKMEVVK